MCDVVGAIEHPETRDTILIDIRSIDERILGFALEAAKELGVEPCVQLFIM